jgi:streptogramin lyase
MNRSGLRFVLLSLAVTTAAMMASASAQAAVITEFTSGVSHPGAMVNGSDGNVWFINGGGIAKIDSSGNVSTYTAGLGAGAAPYDLTNGPNNDVWFTDIGTTKAVGYITTAGTIHEQTDPFSGNPLQIVEGSDGNLWFDNAGGAGNAIVKMTPTGNATRYPLPTLGSIADNMVLGPDGDIWFSDQGTTSIGKIAPSGTISEYPITGSAFPTNITVGSDGDLWFSDNFGKIGQVTTSGSIHEYSVGLQTGAVPDAITAGPDGNVWFTDQSGSQRAIGRITASGQITEFTVGLNQDLPLDITAGADGNLWVPQASMGGTTPSAVAEITPSGQITEITSGVHPDGLQDGDSILAGASGSLWFTDSESPNAIGRIVLAPVAVTGSASAVTTTAGTVSGSVTPRAATTTVTVQYGTSPLLGSSVTLSSLQAGTAAVPVAGSLTGLSPDTTIYFRVVATNAAGEADGAVESFTTIAAAPAQKTTTATLGNQRITVITASPSACVASGGSLPVALNSVAITKSKGAKLKFANAALYLDRGVKHTTTKIVRRHGKRVKLKVTTYKANASTRRLPTSLQLKLTGIKSGSHKLSVRFFYTESVVKRGKRSRKTVEKVVASGFEVC